jgi:hypothetical protein
MSTCTSSNSDVGTVLRGKVRWSGVQWLVEYGDFFRPGGALLISQWGFMEISTNFSFFGVAISILSHL